MRPRLIQKRKEHTMTQEEVATFLNITTRHYQALEAGTSEGSVPVWKKLAQRFSTTIDHLLEQVGDTSDYSNSKRFCVDEAKELDESARDFEVDVETIIDIAEDGRLDDPSRRARAERLSRALEAALM